VAVLAHTILIGEEGPSATPATGKAGDLLAAVYHASEIALRLLKPGSKNSAITDAIEKVAADFKVNAVHGVLSHQMEQNIVDGEKVIINKADVEEKVEEFEFAPYEVYAIDIVMTTGEGKPKERDDRCTVYKRQVDETYSLKMKASRSVLSNIKKNHAIFPFTMRALLATDKAAKFGVKECVEHKLLRAYPVLLEKEGELVAHCKFTALLLPNGTIRVAESGLATTHFESEHKLTDEELVKLLAKSAGNKKKKNNKKKKTAGDKAEVEE
jgi:curved DNA binding protein